MAITRSASRAAYGKADNNDNACTPSKAKPGELKLKRKLKAKVKATDKGSTTTVSKRKATAAESNDNIDNEPKPKKQKRTRKVAKTTKTTTEATEEAAAPTTVGSQVNEEPSSSFSTIAAVAKEPKPKKLTKKAMAKAEMEKVLNDYPPELRNLQGRLYRMEKDRMLVVQRTIVGDFEQRFDVLGSTGNVYKVIIGERIKCSCRDHIYRKQHCKHILLILLKVFHVNAFSPACQSLTLTTTELATVFENCTPDARVIVDAQIQSALDAQLYGKALPPVEKEADDGAKQRPLTTSDCPICFDEFTEEGRSKIIYCKSCGNNVHKACFEAWSTSGRSKVTCVYCRAEWHDSKKKNRRAEYVDNSHLQNEEGYVNVGSLVGMNEARDTSSYGL